MITPLTQILLEPTAIRFVTPTSQGPQMIRVVMALREPTIFAATVSLVDGQLVYNPMALTMREVEAFFTAAKQQWKGKSL